jgi:hypothetical protein
MLHRFHSGIAGSLGWAVFLCVPLAVSSRAVSQERPADAAKSAAASPSVDRILRSWKAREDGTKTLHCVWDTAEVRNGKADRRPALVGSQSECWIGRDNQCRFQTNTERRGGPTGREKMHLSTAFDGRVFFSLNWTKPSKLPPRGKIWNFGERHVGFLTGAMMPLDWAYRPSLRASLSPERFRLVTEDAIVNGLRCTKLRGYDKKGWSLGSFWFDPRQGDALVFWDLAGAESLTMPLSLRYQLDKSSGPVVASWTMSQDDGSNAISTVKTLEINKELPAETFQISFPPGTTVAVDDGATQEAYIVKPDGTKRAIFNLNSVSPRLRKILIPDNRLHRRAGAAPRRNRFPPQPLCDRDHDGQGQLQKRQDRSIIGSAERYRRNSVLGSPGLVLGPVPPTFRHLRAERIAVAQAAVARGELTRVPRPEQKRR